MTTPIVEKDLDNATLTVTTEFDAPLEHVWQLFADPRKRRSGGARPPTRRRCISTSCARAARSSTR